MKIRTQFIITMALFSVLLVTTAASLFLTFQQVDRLNRQRDVAQDIERDARELSYLSNDYLLYRESQQHARWEVKFSELTGEIANLQVDNPEQQTLLNNIKTNAQRLQAIFIDVGSTLENPSIDRDLASEMGIIQISWSRIEVQNQAMIFDAFLLSQKIADEQDQAQATALLLLLGLVALFGVYVVNNYFWIYRHLLRSIAELAKQTKIIGSGNLDWMIPVRHKDEIGELSRAFNHMTANLKQVTASKADLEKEIAERARAEEALALSEERFATTLTSIGDAVIATDTERRITFMNRVAENLSGWTLQDSLGKPAQAVFNIINEETRAPIENPITKVLEQGAIVGLANHSILVRQDGSQVPIDDSAAPIRDRHGNMTGVVLVFRDITERKRAEQALKDREEELSAIYENAPSIMLLVDDERRIYKVNKFGELFANESAAAIRGTRSGAALRCVHSLDDPRGCGFGAHCQHCTVRQTIQKTFDTGLSYNQVEARLSIQRGDHVEDMTFLLSTARLLIRDEMRVLIVLQDITARKRAEDALAASEERFATTLASIGDAVIATDANRNITFMNHVAEKLTGWTLENGMHKPAEAVFNIINEETRGSAKSNRASS